MPWPLRCGLCYLPAWARLGVTYDLLSTLNMIFLEPQFNLKLSSGN